MEAEAAADPAVAAELATLSGVASALKAEDVPVPGKEMGWARISRAIDAETAASRASSSIVKWQVAAAVFGFLAIGQTLFLTSGTNNPTEDQFGLAGEEVITQTWGLQVAFAPDTPIVAIESLLLENGGQISGGPSAIGLYRVTFDSESARDAAAAAFKEASIVLEAMVSD